MSFQKKCYDTSEDLRFQNFILLLIVLNAVLIGVDTFELNSNLKSLIDIAPEDTPASVRNADSPNDDVAVALLPNSKLIERPTVEPPMDSMPEDSRAIAIHQKIILVLVTALVLAWLKRQYQT